MAWCQQVSLVLGAQVPRDPRHFWDSRYAGELNHLLGATPALRGWWAWLAACLSAVKSVSSMVFREERTHPDSRNCPMTLLTISRLQPTRWARSSWVRFSPSVRTPWNGPAHILRRV